MKPFTDKRRANAQRLIVQIGPDMSARGGIASVLSTYASHCDEFENHGYRLLFISSGAGSGRGALGVFLVTWLRLVMLSLTSHIHVVHIHSSIRGSLLRKSVFALTCILFRERYVIHIHSGAFTKYWSSLPNLARKFVRFVLKSSQYVICLSCDAREQLVSMGVALERCRLVYNGVAAPLSAEPREISPSQGITLTFLGKLSEPKGIFRLLEALASLPRSSPKYRLFVGGEGDVKALSALVERYCLTDRIIFGGWVEGADKARLLADTEIFVLPSRSEGFPVSLIEAMAFGAAIVSTRIPGVVDAIRPDQEGLLTDPEDVCGLRDAISMLLVNVDMRRRLGDSARRRFLDQFTIQKTVGNLVSMYDELI